MLRFNLILFFLTALLCYGQTNLADIKPDRAYENILINEISKDSLQSNFVIWVKHSVPAHYHREHTESIYVIEGKGEMALGDKTLSLKPGDFIVIEPNTIHSVTKVKGKRPLKVLSTQAPFFDGSDRMIVKP
jgi:quercetin dioxygenase-like cupin family protein